MPEPVASYYKTIGAESLPVIDSAVISARGTVRFAGITMPGRPIMIVNERYLDGAARMELPVGTVENEPKVDMAANLGLWGESIWLPSIYVTDPRVRWEAIDGQRARLIVPFESDGQTDEDEFIFFFDPTTGLISRMEAIRYKDIADVEKTLWILEVDAWDRYNGLLLPSYAYATWADDGTPWLIVRLDEVVYNVDVGNHIRARGE